MLLVAILNRRSLDCHPLAVLPAFLMIPPSPATRLVVILLRSFFSHCLPGHRSPALLVAVLHCSPPEYHVPPWRCRLLRSSCRHRRPTSAPFLFNHLPNPASYGRMQFI